MTNGSGLTRRQALAAGGGAVAGLAGCTTRATDAPVTLLVAGSLQAALSNGLKPTLDVPVRIEAHGSATVARMIADRKRDPDIVAVADTALFAEPLSPVWHAVFASNAVVVAYDPDSDGGQRVAAAGADGWYEPMRSGTVDIGRTDPDRDPLGYRTLFVLELAARYYGVQGLRERILQREQVYPETSLVSQFETGGVEAAFTYRNMAVERGYEYVDLPPQIDLSDPRYVDGWYETTSYTLPSGERIEGGLVAYGATARNTDEDTLAVFDALTTGDYLADHGFLLRSAFPRYTGDVPPAVERTKRDSTADGFDVSGDDVTTQPAGVSSN